MTASLASISTLPAPVQASCPVCDRAATWVLCPGELSCSPHLGDRLEELHRADPHPFHPYLPVPLRRGLW